MDIGKAPCETPLLPHGYFALWLCALEEHFVGADQTFTLQTPQHKLYFQEFLHYFITSWVPPLVWEAAWAAKPCNFYTIPG